MEKKATTEIGFMGEVQPANCECHKGQFICVAFLLHPLQGRVYLGNAAFETEKIANENLDKFVNFTAGEVLKEMGLTRENAVKVEITHGDEALKSEARVMKDHRESHPDLH